MASEADQGEELHQETPQSKRHQTMVRFTDDLDLELNQEALARNPFGEEYGKKIQAWSDVAVAMSADVDSRRCRERCGQLLGVYEAKEKASQRRSGPSEEYTMKDQLLAELLVMREVEALMRSDRKQQKNDRQQDEEQAATMRDAAMSWMKRGGSNGGSQQQQILAYLERRDAQEHEIEKRKMANEEKRLALEECRLELQEMRTELERSERLAFVDALKLMVAKVSQ